MTRLWGLLLALSGTLAAQSQADVRRAVTRALEPIERSTATFVQQRSCFSCHHNGLAILALRMAGARAFAVDAAVEQAVETKTFAVLTAPNALDSAVQASALNDPTPNDSLLLMAAEAAGAAPDTTLAVYARRIARWQRDGHWITSDFRPPHSSSVFTATATAVRALRAYMPEELRTETAARVEAARHWLLGASSTSTEDATFRLLGLAWSGASMAGMEAARSELLARRNSDGGWPQLPGYDSDAYSTGEALYALTAAGVAPDEGEFRKGLRFLISSQARDGTWRVRTRMLSPADVSPEYFETGFPYKKDQFLSFAGSCWAVMALLSSLEATEPPPTAQPLPTTGEAAPAWARSALFGTSAELAELLDHGLDANAKTDKGTTLLMMAALDAPKVRLLLQRGADVAVRAGQGIDALAIAAAHYGTSDAVSALLAAGAAPEPPQGVRVRRPALVFASMTGDADNLELLLKHGAEPSATALSEAITFGNVDVARRLIQAGAPAAITTGTGVNLLHWAAITNRAAAIPVLAGAGAPIDALDDFGFTPLMYAATIDFGETAALRSLLAAGADPSVRNFDGRTARDLARRLRHAAAEAALR